MGRKFVITNDVLRKLEADPYTYYFDFDTYELITKDERIGRAYTIPFVGAPQVKVINEICTAGGRRERWSILERKYRIDLAVVWCNENAIEYVIDDRAC